MMSESDSPLDGELSIEQLLNSLIASNDPKEQGRILRKLEDIGGNEVYESFFRLLDIKQGELRFRVLSSLTGVDPNRAQHLLIDVINHDDDSDMRWVASSLLLNIATVEILDALIEALNHPDVQVRTSIVVVLGKLGDPRALQALKYARDHDAGKTEDGHTVRGQAEIAIQSIENQAKGQAGAY